MKAKLLIKLCALAASFQIILLMVISPIVSRALERGKLLPDFLVDYVYAPFIRAVIIVGGYRGESQMIWPPVIGILLGIIVYSIAIAIVVGFIRSRS